MASRSLNRVRDTTIHVLRGDDANHWLAICRIVVAVICAITIFRTTVQQVLLCHCLASGRCGLNVNLLRVHVAADVLAMRHHGQPIGHAEWRRVQMMMVEVVVVVATGRTAVRDLAHERADLVKVRVLTLRLIRGR